MFDNLQMFFGYTINRLFAVILRKTFTIIMDLTVKTREKCKITNVLSEMFGNNKKARTVRRSSR